MNKDEAKQLLPWYAVGALESDETRAVEAHLADSSDLQQALAELQVLHRSVGDVADGEPAFRPELINDALRQIDEYEATRPVATGPSLIERGVGWLRETLVTGWIESPRGARVAIVAQFALLLALGGVFLAPEGPPTGPQGSVSQTLAAGQGSTGGTAFNVSFQPEVTELQMRGLLTDISAEVVAGPSAQGSYTIRIEETAEPDVERVLGQMRRNTKVIRFANELE